MALIPEEHLEQIKRGIPLARLAASAGTELEQAGKDLRGRCPFHGPDEDPSLFIEPSRNVFHCFGCGAKGSVIDWRMRTDGFGFREAVESLAREFLPGLLESQSEAELEPFSEETLRSLLDGSEEEVLGVVAAYYRERLALSPRALDYLAERGLGDPKLHEHFAVGFADRTLGLKIPRTGIGPKVRKRLQEIGVLREKTGHEHLNGSIIAPIVDASGQVVQLYGRKVTANLRKGTADHLYLPRSLDCVYHPEALSSDEVILCESIFDAWTFWSAGFRSVTSTFGVKSFPATLLVSLQQRDVKRVLIAFDRDEGGENGARVVAEKLQGVGIASYRVQFPKGMDANECACQVKPAQKSLDLVLRKAEPMSEAGQRLPRSPSPVVVEEKKEQATEEQEANDQGPSPVAASPPEPESPPNSNPPPTFLPAVPKQEIPAVVSDHEVGITLGDRRYRVRGLRKNLSYDTLKVNLLASRDDAFHVDSLDLYSARQRAVFQKAAALELGLEEKVVKKDLGKVLLKLEELQDELIRGALEPQEQQVELSEDEEREALELLRSPDLLSQILEDFARCGVVGEETNKLMGYLAATSRLLEHPLAVVVQSSSSAGKSALMDAVLSLMPEEDRVQYSAMTGQSLFYMGETNLQHKILAIVEEEGAERASYALKLLQSEGELTIASTGKDPQTGKLVTHEYRVEGPVALLLTTTAIDIDEELLNRCLVLSVEESREQTRAIHALQRQRRTLEGMLEVSEREDIRKLHQNAQQLLRPYKVVNAYAPKLTFLDTQVRMRRDHEKYLTLIDAIALLHQMQREVKQMEHRGRVHDYIEVKLQDVEAANGLAHEVLGRSLDELPPQTRRLLTLIDRLVTESCQRLEMDRTDYRFSRREVREWTGWGNTQLKVHLHRLEELEYLLAHQGGRGQPFVYELIYEESSESRLWFLPGLIDVDKLHKEEYDEKKSGSASEKSGQKLEKSAPSRAQVGGVSGGGRIEVLPLESEASSEKRLNARKNAYRGVEEKAQSYRTRTSYRASQ